MSSAAQIAESAPAPGDGEDRQLRAKIVKALKARDGQATLQDVVVDTGIPNLEADRLLRRMIGEYDCHLEVTEDGDILYQFDPQMVPLDQKERRARWLQAVKRRSWSAFSKFAKALIMIVMVVYFVLFVALIIAAMVASRSSQSSSNRRVFRTGGHGGGGNFWLWYFLLGRPSYRHHRRDYRHPSWSRYGGRQSRVDKDPRPFYIKVFSFVLGPERDEVEDLIDDRALLAYIREKKGAVTTAEVSTRTGWSLSESEAYVTRMVAHYDGDLEVTDEGQIVFVFPELLKTAGKRGLVKPAAPFWSKWEAEMPLTGNQSGTNVGIIFLNSFNLVAALAAPSMILPPLQLAATGATVFFLSWFPLTFSALVFTLPLLRYLFQVRPENRRRQERNVRRGLYRTVFQKAAAAGADARFEAEELKAKVRQTVPNRAFTPDDFDGQVEKLLTATTVELDGEVEPGENGQGRLVYSFSDLSEAFEAARGARKRLAAGETLGRRVFSTRDGQATGEDALSRAIEEAAGDAVGATSEADEPKAVESDEPEAAESEEKG